MKAGMVKQVLIKVDSRSCVKYFGLGVDGIYMKKGHNGIPYGDSKLICEAEALLYPIIATFIYRADPSDKTDPIYLPTISLNL